MKKDNREEKEPRRQKRAGGFRSFGDLLMEYDFDKKKYISREFQDYGYRLAMELGEEKNKSLYIKLAKVEERVLLEKARTFIKDARHVKNKGKLFMWALAKMKRGEPLYDGAEAKGKWGKGDK